MAGYQNNMANLLNKIERRLGLIPLADALGDTYGKPAWAEVIKDDTLVTYSRYVPKVISFKICKKTAQKKDGWYYIDEDYLGGEPILGVGDIDWSMFNSRSIGLAQTFGYGVADAGIAAGLTIEDIFSMKERADLASMQSNQLIPEFKAPNRVRLVSVGNNDVNIGDFNINIFVKQDDSLVSIPPTAMQKFEELAQADIATFLVNNLKYWDQLETPLATIDLKMSNLENEASKRDQLIEYFEQNYVSANNKAIPMLMTI